MNTRGNILDGKSTAAGIRAEIAAEVAVLKTAGHRAPHLAAVLVGNDGGSETYVANKVRACRDCGFDSSVVRFGEDVSQDELIDAIRRLNDDDKVDGFIVQLPLPEQINEQAVIEAISPEKDVDGFHPVNVGRRSAGLNAFSPATPAGIVELLRRYGISTAGQHVVIVGRSNIVGKPLADMLMQKGPYADATVTVCHSRTKNLAGLTSSADILVAAAGSPGMITADMVADGAVVIDVGTTRVPDSSRSSGYRICGDVDFDAVAPKASFITPVPGGVGPMTIVSLMRNTLDAYKKKL